MFVFGEVQDPLPETVRLVEDIVRGQIIEIVTRARLLTHLRSSRFLSAEDLIFLIRDDRGKVNRLRTYLSWKDVRKKAKEDDEGGDVDVDEAGQCFCASNVNVTRKECYQGQEAHCQVVVGTFDAVLRVSARTSYAAEQGGGRRRRRRRRAASTRRHHAATSREFRLQAQSLTMIQDADEITKKMTKDEYVHYSDCRQASFTYRKGELLLELPSGS